MEIVSESKKITAFLLFKLCPKGAYPCSLGPSVPGSTQVVQIPSYKRVGIQEKKVYVF